MGEPIGRRRLLTLAGAAGVGGMAMAVGLGGPARATSFGTSFYPINPYRSIDSRPDKLGTNEIVDVDLITDEDLVQRIPSTALAVTYNLTIAGTEQSGFLSLAPADVGSPGSSSINWWQDGLLLANGGTVAIGPSQFTGPGSVSIRCGGGGRTAFLIDITGYFE
jgi:hypothetical protein